MYKLHCSHFSVSLICCHWIATGCIIKLPSFTTKSKSSHIFDSLGVQTHVWITLVEGWKTTKDFIAASHTMLFFAKYMFVFTFTLNLIVRFDAPISYNMDWTSNQSFWFLPRIINLHRSCPLSGTSHRVSLSIFAGNFEYFNKCTCVHVVSHHCLRCWFDMISPEV